MRGNVEAWPGHDVPAGTEHGGLSLAGSVPPPETSGGNTLDEIWTFTAEQCRLDFPLTLQPHHPTTPRPSTNINKLAGC